MIKEQAVFLKILENFIKREKTEAFHDIDWTVMSQYAKDQEVEGIVYYQCKHFLKSRLELTDIKNTLENAFVKTFYRFEAFDYALKEIKTLFKQNDIPFIIVKGLEVAAVYPIPSLRTMGDLDIVVSTGNREKAGFIMEHLGYTVKKGAYEWHCYRQSITIEIHDCLVYNDSSENKMNFFRSFWDYCISSEDGLLRLDNSYHFVFLLEHLKKHFITHGVGFRQFMDIDMFLQANQDLDWAWIEETLVKIDLFEFAKSVFFMCNRWWGTIPPDVLQIITHDDEFFEESTSMIFKNGVFGFNNEEHWENALNKSLEDIKAPSFMKPFIRCFKEVCKPYFIMCRYPNCTFLVGRKYLLPIAWVKRAFFLLKNKHNESIKAMKSMTNSESLRKQKDLRKQWGL